MEKTIRLKIRKELTVEQEKHVIRLKGALVAKGYTEIIHISDDGEEHYINSFRAESPREAVEFISIYQSEGKLEEVVWVLE